MSQAKLKSLLEQTQHVAIDLTRKAKPYASVLLTDIKKHTVAYLIHPGQARNLSLPHWILFSLHSGQAFRRSLPIFLQFFALSGLVGGLFAWAKLWSIDFIFFERWDLVRAFIAQILILVVILVTVRITLLRAQHLWDLPIDEFVVLKAGSILCRWLGEVIFVPTVGLAVAVVLQRNNPLFFAITEAIPASGEMDPTLLTGAFSAGLFYVLIPWALMVFIIFYSVATFLELWMKFFENANSVDTLR